MYLYMASLQEDRCQQCSVPDEQAGAYRYLDIAGCDRCDPLTLDRG